MYLSTLLIDVGADPDRPRPARQWLRNHYRVHQRLCMAFPSRPKRDADPHFLQPYRPGDFRPPVQIPRTEDNGFLYRLDPVAGGNPVIVVQSGTRPDWEYAFHNARHFLAADPGVFDLDPRFSVGQRLVFRLKANPTKRLSEKSRDASGKPLDPKWVGKRVPVPAEQVKDWLARRGAEGGFEVLALTREEAGYVHFDRKIVSDDGQRLRSMLLEGILRVSDADTFRKTLSQGIGSGKAFGFGLLSVRAAP